MPEFTGHPEDYESPEPPMCSECGEALEEDEHGHLVCPINHEEE
jgi:hypothetical protein